MQGITPIGNEEVVRPTAALNEEVVRPTAALRSERSLSNDQTSYVKIFVNLRVIFIFVKSF